LRKFLVQVSELLGGYQEDRKAGGVVWIGRWEY